MGSLKELLMKFLALNMTNTMDEASRISVTVSNKHIEELLVYTATVTPEVLSRLMETDDRYHFGFLAGIDYATERMLKSLRGETGTS